MDTIDKEVRRLLRKETGLLAQIDAWVMRHTSVKSMLFIALGGFIFGPYGAGFFAVVCYMGYRVMPRNNIASFTRMRPK